MSEDKINSLKVCTNCNGEGFLIVKDIDDHFIKECPKCEGEGVLN